MARSLAFLFALVLIMLATTKTESAITCGSLVSHLSPCIPYAQGKGPLSATCCTGMKQMVASATTTGDRQLACKCLQSIAGQMSGLNFGLIAGAPAKCGVNVGYPISRSTDCSKVK